MFKTHKNAEVNFYGLFGEPQSQHWRLIESNLFHPWFCVTITEVNGDRTVQRTLLPSDVQILVDILNQQDEGLAVTDVLVMMPSWMTGSDRWRLERLIELRSGSGIEGQPVNFYVTDEGYVYQDFGPTDEYVLNISQIEKAEIIYARELKT